MTFQPTQCADAVRLLTPRQREVLAAVASGRPRKQLADEMGITPRTFECHCFEIYRRLNVSSAIEATRVAVAAGLT